MLRRSSRNAAMGVDKWDYAPLFPGFAVTKSISRRRRSQCQDRREHAGMNGIRGKGGVETGVLLLLPLRVLRAAARTSGLGRRTHHRVAVGLRFS